MRTLYILWRLFREDQFRVSDRWAAIIRFHTYTWIDPVIVSRAEAYADSTLNLTSQLRQIRRLLMLWFAHTGCKMEHKVKAFDLGSVSLYRPEGANPKIKWISKHCRLDFHLWVLVFNHTCHTDTINSDKGDNGAGTLEGSESFGTGYN